MAKQISSIMLPSKVYKNDTAIFKYFSDNNKIVESATQYYADEEEVSQLLTMAIQIINRAGMNRDMDFVKNTIKSMLVEMTHVIEKNNIALSDGIEAVLENSFDANVDSSYLGKTKVFLREQLSSFKDSTRSTIELLLRNAEKLSTDKMVEVEGKLATLQEKLNPDLETSYLGLLKKTVKAVEESIDNQFDNTNKQSFICRLEEQLENIADGDSPLMVQFKAELEFQRKYLKEELAEIRDIISREQGKEEMIKSTAQMKGQRFEDSLFSELQSIAKPFGDIVQMMGTKAEVGGSKKGDFIYEFAEGYRVVIEAKDTKLTLPPMIKYLDDAMKTRDCSFSILVAKDESCLPKQVGNFNFYDDNKLFVTTDFLEHALRWTKLFVSKVQVEIVEGVDKSAIKTSLQAIQNHLKVFTTMKSKLTKLSSAVDTTTRDIETLIEVFQSNVDVELKYIAEQLNDV